MMSSKLESKLSTINQLLHGSSLQEILILFSYIIYQAISTVVEKEEKIKLKNEVLKYVDDLLEYALTEEEENYEAKYH